MFGTLLILCLCLALVALWQQREAWLLVWRLNKWHGILQQPLLWFLLLFHLDPKSILQSVTNLRKNFKRPLAVVMGTRSLIYVDDPRTMEQIFNSHECLDKTFLQNGFFARKGLLHAKGQKWKIRRKQLNPAFSQAIVLSFLDIFNLVGNQLQMKFHMDLQGVSVKFKNVEDMLSRAVLEVSCLTIMGTATSFTQKDEQDIAKAYKTLMEISALKIIKPWLQCDALFKVLDSENYQRSSTCNKLVQQFVTNIVKNKYQQWLQDCERQENENCFSIKEAHGKNGDKPLVADESWEIKLGAEERDCNFQNAAKKMDSAGYSATANKKRIFIEQLFHLKQSGELTLQEIMDEAESMVLVSFETVSTSITLVLLCLAIHTDCQLKLREEIFTVFSQSSEHHFNQPKESKSQPKCYINDISVEQLQRMKYLDMVINETLRLLTTVPMNLRHVSKAFDLKLPLSNNSHPSVSVKNGPAQKSVNQTAEHKQTVRIPKNSIIALDTFNMQRDENHWGCEAKKFNPLRFASAPLASTSASPTDTSTNVASVINDSASSILQARHPYAFVPFSKGLRTCIGSRYSFFVMKVFLIKLMANFEFSTNITMHDLRFTEGISLKLSNSDQITFQIKNL